ncbi:MAG: hypothetical protein ACOX5R_10015 [bacterium]|jgi:hypothetical protein
MKEESEKMSRFDEAVMIGYEQIERGQTVPYSEGLMKEIASRAKQRAAKGEKPISDATPSSYCEFKFLV